MFNAARQYGAEFDASTWTPIGGQAVQSDVGITGMVQQPLQQQQAEYRMAGNALAQAMNVRSQKRLYDAQLEAYENASGGGGGGSSSSGGGSGIGSTIGAGVGLAASALIPGAQAFAGPNSAVTSGIGGLFD